MHFPPLRSLFGLVLPGLVLASLFWPTAEGHAAASTTLVFTPVADAAVNPTAPTHNYGDQRSLQALAAPARRSYLRFNVQGVDHGVTKATLKVYANTSSDSGLDVYAVSNDTWGELTITYDNAPAMGKTKLASSGKTIRGTWVELDVTSYVTGNGLWSLAVVARNGAAVSMASREVTSLAPQLVVEAAEGEQSTPTPPPPPTGTPTFTPTRTATAVPTATPGGNAQVYWGAYVDGVPWNMTIQDAFEGRAQKAASIIHWGQPWILNGTYQPFYAGDFQAVRDRGSIPMLDWGSWDYTKGMTQADFQLSDIYGGLHDTHIRNWAAAAKAWGHPFFLRFDWEMNGWWQFPWAEQVNGNQPGDYVKAWRHVHDLFVEEGATNVTWVWCPNIVDDKSTSLKSLYPGDKYVDWVGMDGYNFGSYQGNQWQTFSEVFGATYKELGQVAHDKPIMIAEVASSEMGGSKAAWISDALSTQLPKEYPEVKAFVWFNWNDGDPNLTWPIESSQSSIDAFAGGITSAYYAANTFANIDSSTILPLK